MDVIIAGNVQNLPANKLYLSDARQWDRFIDSTDYLNGRFQFNYHTPPGFEPFLANISYVDPSGKIKPLIFRNNVLLNDEKEFGTNAFYLEKAPVYIEGDFLTAPKLSIKAGQETMLLFRYQLVNWGAMNEQNQSVRQQELKEIEATVDRNKESFYLLTCILNNRYSYSKTELRKILNLFSPSIQKSYTGERLDGYITGLSDSRINLKNISLINNQNLRENVIGSTKRLNILVFWGSWCAPCRLEIPQLKDLYSTLPKTRVRMVSIAINDQKTNWRHALNEEKMKWTQLYANERESEDIKVSLNIPSVPLILITDQSGNEVYREIGFSRNRNEMINIVDSLLSK